MCSFCKKWFPQPADYPASRLFCLDLLRGMDMFLLTAIGPMMHAAQKSWNCFSPETMAQLRHNYLGFTLWDIIMPLFIFMCGAAIPFALSRRLENGKASWGYWRHVLGRVLLLWFLGMLVQGQLASLNILKIDYFSNTLQSIAIGYLITAAVFLIPRRAIRIAITILLALVYTLTLAVYGDYSELGNAAIKIDQWIQAIIFPAGHERLRNLYMYSWYFTSCMFAFMTLIGFHATEILKSGLSQKAKALALFSFGAAMLVLGWAVSPWIPVIKPIYSLSFTLQAMGWCTLALAALYVVTDIFKFRFGTAILLLYGQFALTAYFVTHFFRSAVYAVAESIGQGAPQLFGKEAQPFVIAVLAVCVTIAVMAVWRQWKSFKNAH